MAVRRSSEYGADHGLRSRSTCCRSRPLGHADVDVVLVGDRRVQLAPALAPVPEQDRYSANASSRRPSTRSPRSSPRRPSGARAPAGCRRVGREQQPDQPLGGAPVGGDGGRGASRSRGSRRAARPGPCPTSRSGRCPRTHRARCAPASAGARASRAGGIRRAPRAPSYDGRLDRHGGSRSAGFPATGAGSRGAHPSRRRARRGRAGAA